MSRINNILLLLLVFGMNAAAQVGTTASPTPQEQFLRIRTLVEADRLEEAEALAYVLLEDQPGYDDVRVYLSLIHGRQGEYETGLSLVGSVLTRHPGTEDALRARSSLLYWSEDWSALLAANSEALEVMPGDPDLLYKQAIAHYKQDNGDTALEILDQLLEDAPQNDQALQLKAQVLASEPAPELFARYMFDHFRQPYNRRWHMVTLGGNYPIAPGTISPYFNMGHFISDGETFLSTTAFQLNADAYLDITPKNYLLLGYGIGTGTYLPRHRAAVHLWQVLPAGWSVSAGARYFYFDQHYLFYALGVDKYLGNYWFDLKNYIFNKAYGVSVSSHLTVRRYFENKYNYVSATIGYGTSPDEPVTVVADLQRLNALSVRIEIMKQLSARTRFGAGVGYAYEEYPEQLFRNRLNMQAGFYYTLDGN
ncbi:MAG: YaiO family outer membrane beta-barrel protein [Bacteroidales bacterium]|nr:YaiO family outer membrane beta-barrel protein [Bacteroidales bacterium]MDT8430442.1 YaiO family outer membrane beta-barrel protein [Bacteroidales bacterium]